MKNIVNIINFIRGVEPRPGRNIDLKKPVLEQIKLLAELGLKGTFLLQYDALCDEKIVSFLKQAPKETELGVWLEVVQPQVEKVGLVWRGRYPWDWHNDVGFLIGYLPEERKRLIDEHLQKFEETFGYLPKSVGSWHIDAVSMAYLSERYQIDACCICRDQVGTDGYTLQGGYYNQAYYPSKRNMFTPAQTRENQINMPVFRMLGSSAAFAYDFQLFDYDGICGTIPTLEPAQLAANNEWGDHLLGEIFDGKGLAFQYAQIGQENSFGWEKMREGLEFQFRKVAQMAQRGEIEILTLGETGRWFRNQFSSTPATAYVADRKWKSNDILSYWYNCKNYRANFCLENGILRLRDLYVFNENYSEKYLTERCKSYACEYRNLPIFDGVLYSDKEKGIKAGCYFYEDDRAIIWKNVVYEEKDNSIILSLTSECGILRICLGENAITIDTDIEQLTIVPIYDRNAVYGAKGNDDATFSNHNGKASLSYITQANMQEKKLEFVFDNVRYSIELQDGFFVNGFQLNPSNGKLVVSMA